MWNLCERPLGPGGIQRLEAHNFLIIRVGEMYSEKGSFVFFWILFSACYETEKFEANI